MVGEQRQQTDWTDWADPLPPKFNPLVHRCFSPETDTLFNNVICYWSLYLNSIQMVDCRLTITKWVFSFSQILKPPFSLLEQTLKLPLNTYCKTFDSALRFMDTWVRLELQSVFELRAARGSKKEAEVRNKWWEVIIILLKEQFSSLSLCGQGQILLFRKKQCLKCHCETVFLTITVPWQACAAKSCLVLFLKSIATSVWHDKWTLRTANQERLWVAVIEYGLKEAIQLLLCVTQCALSFIFFLLA